MIGIGEETRTNHVRRARNVVEFEPRRASIGEPTMAAVRGTDTTLFHNR